MAIIGTKEAKALLYQIARKHNTDPKSVIEGPRWPEYTVVKQEFCQAVKERGIPLRVAADILGLDHSTVVHHASPEIRARKKQTRTRGTAYNEQHSGAGES